MTGEKNFQPPVEPTKDKKAEAFAGIAQKKAEDGEVDSQEEKEDKGTEEEKKIELSVRFKAIQDIMDYKRRQKGGMMSEKDDKYFRGTGVADDVFVRLQWYISECLQHGAPVDEIEKNIDILEYSVGELLKDDTDRGEVDKRLTQFVKGRIDHFVATFDQRIESIKKSGRLVEENIEKAKKQIDWLSKQKEDVLKQGKDFEATGKVPSQGDAKILMQIASDMEHAIPGVEASHEAALVFSADNFEEEKKEERQ